VLEAVGARATATSSVVQEMRAFETKIPQVVVSDIGMPEHDGAELIGRIRELAPESGGRVPAVALTGHAGAVDRTKVLSACHMIHLAKPVEPDEMVAAVSSLARFA